jgi:predicted nuclease of predicted toxin-antitoxin system
LRILANENFPRQAVEALRTAGHDVWWARTEAPGLQDVEILARARQERRLVATFDKDFGELAFRQGLPAECGIVLFRLALPSPESVARKVVAALEGRSDWPGRFSVVEESQVRMRPLARE